MSLTKVQFAMTVITANVTSAANITPNTGATQFNVLALSQSANISPPAGLGIDGQKLLIRIKDNGSSQNLSWNTSAGAYRAFGITLPSASNTKNTYVGCVYNAQDNYWDAIATGQL